jgi:hypothetical protein
VLGVECVSNFFLSIFSAEFDEFVELFARKRYLPSSDRFRNFLASFPVSFGKLDFLVSMVFSGCVDDEGDVFPLRVGDPFGLVGCERVFLFTRMKSRSRVPGMFFPVFLFTFVFVYLLF